MTETALHAKPCTGLEDERREWSMLNIGSRGSDMCGTTAAIGSVVVEITDTATDRQPVEQAFPVGKPAHAGIEH